MKNLFLSTQQIYKIDEMTSKKFLIPSFTLMENAGRSAAEVIRDYARKKNFKKIVLFCGPGRNGGDGFVAGRYLHIWGFEVLLVLVANKIDYKDDALLNYKIVKRLNVKIKKFNSKIRYLIKNYDVVVDAIFGIGLKRELKGIYKEAVELINLSKKVVFSVDIPSGLHADTGEVMGVAVKADYTLTIGFLKKCFKYEKTKKYLGKIKVLDIGYPVSKLV
ncbi:MAG: NAD(P)H-hydrate epimerase [Endomicrobiia bacterium]